MGTVLFDTFCEITIFAALFAAGGMFAATYVPLMWKTLGIAKEMKDEESQQN